MEQHVPGTWLTRLHRSDADSVRSTRPAQPYIGDADMDDKRPEVVNVQPVIAGRRRIRVFESVDDTNDAFYAPIEAYEGRHRYNPKFEWESQEERCLVRKVSSRLHDF
jgi:hypothetical protein